MKHEDLIQKFLNGEELTEQEQLELNRILHDSKDARRELIQQGFMDSFLREQLTQGAQQPPSHSQEQTTSSSRKFLNLGTKAASLILGTGLLFYLFSISSKQESMPPKVLLVENNPPPSAIDQYQETIQNLPGRGSMNRPTNQKNVMTAESDLINFNRDIRPILSENCFHCHGPDADNREADIALHTFEFATQAIKDHPSQFPIVPGKPENSLVWKKINDAKDPMPPEDSNLNLSSREKQLIKKWIESGAKYEKHWAFKTPQKVLIPQAQQNSPIDYFIQQKLVEKNLPVAPKADSPIIARRASLVLTGLLPSHESPAYNKLMSHPNQTHYEAYLDELMNSYDYAERMTLMWLDYARYSDSDGYSDDKDRSNWPWRDWVIEAFKQNMPYHQFTIEQLAGDLLPNPTPSQIIATAFNRNHRQNNEGGVLAEEFFVENVIDRVETTSTVWLGLTMGCARCHDHKYDELTQKDFYQLFAYFNNIGEVGKGRGISAKPLLQTRSPMTKKLYPELVQQIESKEHALEELQGKLNQNFQTWLEQLRHNFSDNTQVTWTACELEPQAPVLKAQNNKPTALKINPGTLASQKVYGLKLELKMEHQNPNQNAFLSCSEISLTSENSKIDIISWRINKADKKHTSDFAFDDKAATLWKASLEKGQTKPVTVIIELDLLSPLDSKPLIVNFKNLTLQNAQASINVLATNSPKHFLSAHKLDSKSKSSAQINKLLQRFSSLDHNFKSLQNDLQSLEAKLTSHGHAKVPLMVMKEKKDIQPAYLLKRGLYNQFDPNKPLSRSIPAAFIKPGLAIPQNRLEFAKWLVSENNPLTARVTVNHFWQMIFGRGLVKTSEDFGTQGSMPSHPLLLDWLAVEFMESNWDIKALLKLILSSETFQRSSVVLPVHLENDPENIYLSRGLRYRLNAFSIRDKALQASGLMNKQLGGAPVKPYQPDGLWYAVAEGGKRYIQDTGEKVYRKSLYTFSKRTVIPPNQSIFDAVSREVCSVSNQKTNTALQALTLMNDPTFLEAANHLGLLMMKYHEQDLNKKLSYGYQKAIGLKADETTLINLRTFYQSMLKEFQHNPQNAKDLLSVGQKKLDQHKNYQDLAAFASVAHLILNLDEAIVVE